jgi:hypothetical protein
MIAKELVRGVRANLKIDWTVRENVRAEMRVLVKRILAATAIRRISRRALPSWFSNRRRHCARTEIRSDVCAPACSSITDINPLKRSCRVKISS